MRYLLHHVLGVRATLVFLITFLGASVLTTPAQATTRTSFPHCTTAVTVTVGGGHTLTVPAHPRHGTQCLMGPGDRGGAVALLHNALIKCHGIPLTMDGSFGEHTHDALTGVQAHLKLSSDGVYGPATRDALLFPVDGGTPTATRCVRIGDR